MNVKFYHSIWMAYGEVKIGYMIWLSENGDLNSVNGKGWLSKEEWDVPNTNDFEVSECKTYYLDVNRCVESVRKMI